MLVLSLRRVALYCALFFIAGLQARPILDALVSGHATPPARDVVGVVALLVVGVIAISKSRRIPA